MNFKDKKTKNFMIGIVGALLVVAGCATIVYAFTGGDQYSIYKLNGQSIGTIEDRDNCLIFDANRISYDGDRSFSKPEIEKLVSDAKYLHTSGSDEGPATLYFAKENEPRADLEDGDFIIVKWERIGTGGYWIRGVWAWDDFIERSVNPLPSF